MSDSNKLPYVDYRLKNINNALYIDGNDDVVVRTGFAGNIVISGNVNVPGVVTVDSSPENPVHVHVTELPSITGNVDVNNFPDFPSNVSITEMPGITGNVHIYGNIGGSDQPITVNQGTSPWITNTTITGTTTVAFPPGATNLFGELYSSVITPTIQIDALHGLDQFEIQTYTGGGGNVSTANNVYECSSTSTVGSYGLVRSRDFNSFRSGQSLIGRWLAKFSTPKAGTSQRVGLNNQESGYYFGYNEETFGILKVSGGKVPIYKVTITSYTGAQTVTLTLNGVAYTINLLLGESIQNAAQRIAENSLGGLWLANQRDNTVILLYAGALGPLNGTFSISSSGNLVGSVTALQQGVAVTNTWYLDGQTPPAGATQFNKPSWLTPTNYASYAIKYLMLGARFYAVNPNTGLYEQIYGIGTTDTLPVDNPTFKTAALALNTGGSETVTTTVAAMFAAVEGGEARVTNTSAASVTQTSLTQNTILHLLSIQNPYVHNSKINTLQTAVLDLTVSMQCNDPTQVYIYIDQPLATGLHDFVSQDGKPTTVSTVAGTIAASAIPINSFIVGTTGTTTQFDLQAFRTTIPPGATLTIGVFSTATIQKASAALVWYNV